ncbi:Protein EARLY-RESPONSIVE TO DEHYDRATION 7, chloroplastic [Ancistrocladus abbreviatus]
MTSQEPQRRPSLYPEVDQSNPEASSPLLSSPNRNPTSSSSSSLYPSVDVDELSQNLFPDTDDINPNPSPNPNSPSAPPEPVSFEETIISIPGAIVHLIDKQYSVELACGNLSIIRLRQGDNVIAILARVDDEVQWPLTKDEAAVKVDDAHYFFSLRPPKQSGSDSSDDEGKGKENGNDDMLLNYGLSFASKGQEKLLKELDGIFESYCSFSVQKVSEKSKEGVLDTTVAKETSPEDLKSEGKRQMMEERCAAYWTTLAPNVEDYSGTAARLIAAGSGQLIKGILWCGDVTMDRLKWGNEVLKRKMSPSKQVEVSPATLKRIRRVKRVTKMTEKVAKGVVSGVLKISGFFTSSVVNSKAGKKFFSLLPGEVVLASLDAFNKICDAAEVAGRNVMSTSSTLTTEFVTHRYGEDAGKATNEGLSAAGHAIGTAWAVFKIRKALNPKSSLKATTIAKSAAKAAAAEYKSKKK